MKKFVALIMLVLSTFAISVRAQVVLRADTVSGCGKLVSTFSFQPALDTDTVQSISWDFGNGTIVTGIINPTVTYDRPGLYDVAVVINSDFILEEPGFISVFPIPNPSFYYSDSLAAGDYDYVFYGVQQETDSMTYSYEWTFSDGGSASGEHVNHNFGSAGNYVVSLRVKDNFGCADSISRHLQINDILELPNVFTPNGDGINDYFNIRTNGINLYLFSVYTRSGILVYRSESPYIIWDGRSFSGQEMNDGIYYFTISQTDGDNPYKGKGFVQLLR